VNPLTSIPPSVRKFLYSLYALTALAFGAVSAWYSTEGDEVPGWLPKALAVMGYLGIALGAMAASNITPALPTTTVVNVMDPLAAAKMPDQVLDGPRSQSDDGDWTTDP
jgi:hypothetical protein